MMPTGSNSNNRETTDQGMSRLALSSADKQVRDWFVETTKQLGCDLKIDTMGDSPFHFIFNSSIPFCSYVPPFLSYGTSSHQLIESSIMTIGQQRQYLRYSTGKKGWTSYLCGKSFRYTGMLLLILHYT